MDELPETASEDVLEEQTDVRLALSQLPKEFRETAVLFFIQGLTQTQIAKILGIGVPLVKYRIKRARTLMAAILETEERI